MRYDFETWQDRTSQGSAKWLDMHKKKENVAPDTVPLSVADMEFPLVPEIRDGLKEHLSTVVLGYTEPTPYYFQTICDWLSRRQNLEVDSAWIVPTPGVVVGIGLALQASTQEDDGVIVMTPVYYPFFEVIRATHRQLLEMELTNTEGEYSIDMGRLEDLAASEDAKALLLCSPHNPVGRVWTKTELEDIGEICARHNLTIISDEIHADLIMPGHRHTPFLNACPKLREQTVLLTAPSKTFNLAGMQASSAIIPNDSLRERFRQARRASGNVELPALSYVSTELAYTRCDAWYEQMIETIDANRIFSEEFFRTEMPSVRVTPLQGTYLQWFDMRWLGLDAKELEKRMIEADLFFDEGYIFGAGGAGFERMNLAVPRSVLQAAMNRLRDKAAQIR